MLKTNHKMDFITLIVAVITLTATVESTYYVELEPKCDCVCRDSFMDAAYAHMPLCHVISRFEKELLTVKQEIERRTVFIHDIAELKEIMEEQEDMIKTLQGQVEKLSSTTIVSEDLPTPAALVMKDQMQGDSSRETRSKEEKELVNNVSTLIAKVEEVENLTSKVQEELKSERRVRRHLEEDLNETRFSIKMLDDKLLNVTVPMDSRVTHVEEIVLSTLENMNKTFFEDHIKKLYYKVDGVVYKNETEKLDERLDQVETELMDANNINTTLKLVEGLTNLTDILSTMNQTIMGKLAEEESRLGSLENKTDKLDALDVLQVQMKDLLNKTSKLDELQELQEQVTILLNVTELMQTRAVDLWTDIQNVRNTTAQLEKEFYDQSSLTNQTVASLQQELSGKLQTLNESLSNLKAEVVADQASLAVLHEDVKILSADVAISDERVLSLTAASDKMMEEISTKIENLTGVWDNSLSILVAQIEQWKNSKPANDSSNSHEPITQKKNSGDWTEDGDDDNDVDVVNIGRLRGKGSDEQVGCDLPSISDEHLLVTLEEDSEGVQTLAFGCRPIGRYGLEAGPVPLKCRGGFWHGSFPRCARLKNETEIIALSQELKQPPNPCLDGDGDSPDITDCSYFYQCTNGIAYGRVNCPLGLLFDVQSRRCEWPSSARCGSSLDVEGSKLRDLIPPILIEPDNVDKPFGLMGTNDAGHLIVYPNTNLKLHCLFPENQLGPATWVAQHFSTDFEYPASALYSKHRSTLEFDSISNIFSGTYTCKTPYNKKHSITIVVEAVKCPAFLVDSEREKALTYNGHPDGGERILTTTAQFLCEGGSSITATCLANGTWSRFVPTVQECPPKRAKIWGCDVFVKQSEDDPEVKYDNHKREIRFSCPGNRRLVGGAVATCINNSWTLSPFPKCK